jgi:hypothetical protein
MTRGMTGRANVLSCFKFAFAPCHAFDFFRRRQFRCYGTGAGSLLHAQWVSEHGVETDSHQRRNLLSFGGTHGIPLFFLVSIGNYDFVSFGIQAAKFVVVNNNLFMARRCSRILFATTHYCLAENMSPKKVHETLK